MLWKLLPGHLVHQAATASSALIGKFGQGAVLGPRSVHQKSHLVPSSVQRSPALTQPECHLEHQVQRTVSSLHSASDIGPQPHRAEHRLQRVGRPQMYPVLGREVVEARERLPVPNHCLFQRVVTTFASSSFWYTSRAARPSSFSSYRRLGVLGRIRPLSHSSIFNFHNF